MRAAMSDGVAVARRKTIALDAARPIDANTTGRRPISSDSRPKKNIVDSEPMTYTAYVTVRMICEKPNSCRYCEYSGVGSVLRT